MKSILLMLFAVSPLCPRDMPEPLRSWHTCAECHNTPFQALKGDGTWVQGPPIDALAGRSWVVVDAGLLLLPDGGMQKFNAVSNGVPSFKLSDLYINMSPPAPRYEEMRVQCGNGAKPSIKLRDNATWFVCDARDGGR